MSANEPEIRIGLVLYGGVSLAIYIYGVVIEVQRLLRAAQALSPEEEDGKGSAYARALRAAGSAGVTVDVISGTSAGGINGILLARALACGGDLERARDLWVDDGDIDQLLQPPGVAAPKGLLNSIHFAERLEEGLRRLRPEPDGRALPPPSILDLFVSSTHLRGGRRRFSDSLGRTIDTRQHRYLFQLKLRSSTPGAPGGYEHDDFRDDARLTKLARATSAFPVAFEPVEIVPGDGLLEDGHEASGWFADGGILNNKPFTEAIGTIFRRRSQRPVRRWLFSVDPDPVTVADGAGPGPEPAFDQIAVRSVASIPRYQSIARDLAALDAHNAAVAEAEQVVRRLEAEIASEEPPEGGEGEQPQAPSLGPGPAAAYATMRRQAWELEVADRMIGAARGEGPEADRAAVHAALRAGAGEALREREGGDLADLAFQRRRVYYLLKLIAMAGVDPDEARVARTALWAEFERISAALDAALAAPWREPGDGPASAGALRRHAGLAADPGLAQELAADLLAAALPGFEEVGAGVGERLAGALEGISLVLDGSAPGVLRLFGVELTGVLADFERRDALLLPAELYGGLGRRDRIRHAQISPVAAGNTGVAPERRLGGATLGHFGGFLDRDWRRNDLMWGRLDGAEVLMRAILDEREDEEEKQELIDDVQEEVLRAEGMGHLLEGPESWKQKLADHIGDGFSPGDLDGGRMVDLGLRAAAVVRRMLRAASEAEAKPGLLSRARALALRATGNGVAFLLALVHLPAKALFAKGAGMRRVLIAAALLPTLWGLATLALGIAGVLPFTGVAGPAALAIAVYPAFLAVYWLLAWARAKLSSQS